MMANLDSKLGMCLIILSIKIIRSEEYCQACSISSFREIIKNGCQCKCEMINSNLTVTLKCKDNAYGYLKYKTNEIDTDDETLLQMITKLSLRNLKATNLLQILKRVSIVKTPNLKQLEIYDIKVGKFYPEAFSTLTGLETLALENLTLSDLPTGLNNLKELRQLFLRQNQLTFLNGSPELPNLIIFNANFNKLQTVSENFFENFPNLETLDLSNNNITVLNSSLCTESLKMLNLNNNGVGSLDGSFAEKCESISGLFLKNNFFEVIASGSFPKTLNELDLSKNRNIIKSFPRTAFDTEIPKINLNDNRFLCSCELQWIKDNRVNFVSLDSLRCRNGTKMKPLMQVEFCEKITTQPSPSIVTTSIESITHPTTSVESITHPTTSIVTISIETITSSSNITSSDTVSPSSSTFSAIVTSSETEALNPATPGTISSSFATLTESRVSNPSTTESTTISSNPNPTDPAITELPGENCFINHVIEQLTIHIDAPNSSQDNYTAPLLTFTWNGSEVSKRNESVMIKHRILENDYYWYEAIYTVDASQGYYNYTFSENEKDTVRVICIGLLEYDILDKNCVVARAPTMPPSKQVIERQTLPKLAFVIFGSFLAIALIATLFYNVMKKAGEKNTPNIPIRRDSTKSYDTYISISNFPEGYFVVKAKKLPPLPVNDGGYLTILDDHHYNSIRSRTDSHTYDSIRSRMEYNTYEKIRPRKTPNTISHIESEFEWRKLLQLLNEITLPTVTETRRNGTNIKATSVRGLKRETIKSLLPKRLSF